MNSYRLAGALWLMAGLVCTGLLAVVLVGENLHNLAVLLRNPVLPALVMAGAIGGLSVGSLLIRRPGPRVASWSTVVGVVWVVIFGSLAVGALNGPDRGPLMSSSLITLFGGAGSLVAYLSRRADLRAE